MSSANYSKKAEPHFGEWLRQMRLEKDLPLRVVAAEAEMDQAHLSKIELGQRLPTEEQTSKLAKFFKVAETEIQARRMAEKFREESEKHPAAGREALYILAEEAGIYPSRRKG
jgi:transcriptional regulator with XRE-family HTH domain